MREIKYIVLHCTATPQTASVQSILSYWRTGLGWRNPGYHFLIEPNGKINALQDISKISNGVVGYNQNSIHISYIGGIDANNKPIDNRTIEQRGIMLALILNLKKQFPNAQILGHCDFPGVNKACPSFNVKEWLNEIKTLL